MRVTSPRYKVADEALGRVFVGSSPSQAERARRAYMAGGHSASVAGGLRATTGADGPAPPAPTPPATRERADVETLLSLLELDHNTIAREGDTHESAVEIARASMLAKLEALAMTATGALRATRPRPDLAVSAAADATSASAAAFEAFGRSAGPLAKTVASEMMRASSTAQKLAAAVALLPGATPMQPGEAPGPAREPELDEVETRPRSRGGAGLLLAGLFGVALVAASRRGRR